MSVRSSAAGCSAVKDSVDRTNYIDTSARTPETEDSNVSTAAGDLRAPTICRNTRALTWRHLANATTTNYHTTPPPSPLLRIKYFSRLSPRHRLPTAKCQHAARKNFCDLIIHRLTVTQFLHIISIPAVFPPCCRSSSAKCFLLGHHFLSKIALMRTFSETN